LQAFDQFVVDRPASGSYISLSLLQNIREELRTFNNLSDLEKAWNLLYAFFVNTDTIDIYSLIGRSDDIFLAYINANYNYLMSQYYPSLGVQFTPTETENISQQVLALLQKRWAQLTYIPPDEDEYEGIISENPESEERLAVIKARKEGLARAEPILLTYYLQYLTNKDYDPNAIVQMFEPRRIGLTNYHDPRIADIRAFQYFFDQKHSDIPENVQILEELVTTWEDKIRDGSRM